MLQVILLVLYCSDTVEYNFVSTKLMLLPNSWIELVEMVCLCFVDTCCPHVISEIITLLHECCRRLVFINELIPILELPTAPIFASCNFLNIPFLFPEHPHRGFQFSARSIRFLGQPDPFFETMYPVRWLTLYIHYVFHDCIGCFASLCLLQ